MPGKSPPPRTAQALQSLRRMIFSGALAPGSDHLESALAARLGLSRTPVREALLGLAAQGLVEVRPRRGVRICAVSPRDLAEIHDILSELEGLAAAHAAGRGHDTAALAPLAHALDRMDCALHLNDRPAWARADAAFHTELVQLGGNSRAIAIVAMLGDQLRRARQALLFLRPPPYPSNEEHRAVFRAIAAGHADLARDLHRAQCRAERAMLLGLIAERRLDAL